MNKIRNNQWIVLSVLFVLSCNESKDAEIFHHTKVDCKEIITANDSCIQWGEIPENWQLTSNEIICRTLEKDSLYKLYTANNVKLVSSFGKKGHGSSEWVAPHLLVKNDSSFVVFDNGTKKLYNVVHDTISYLGISAINEPINDTKAINYPIIGYVSILPNEQSLKIVNIEQDEIIDRISFVDEKEQGNSSLYDFTWNVVGDKIVIAHLYADRFSVSRINEKGRLLRTDIYETTSGYSKDKLNYSDVQCGHYIYLLSQKNIDVNKMEGYSEIDVYDYDGNHQYKIKLAYIADKILLDARNSRLLTTSVSDEFLHIISLDIAE